MISTHSTFLAGVTTALMLVAAVAFLRFYWRTRDPLFVYFSISFFLQAMTRATLTLAGMTARTDMVHAEGQVWLYGLRLISYSLIIFAIVQKNRAPARRPGGESAGPNL
jgi:hypothetical protein